jgi:hypothetical protein
MLVERRNLGWGLVALWIIATNLGWTVDWSPHLGQGNFMLFVVGASSGMDPTPIYVYFISGILVGVLNGTILGVGQWLILRNQVRRAYQWLFATLIGTMVGLSLGMVLNRLLVSLLRAAYGWESGVQLEPQALIAIVSQSAAASKGIVGFTIGLFQWLILRNWVQWAGWWIVASIAAWAIGGAGYWLVYGMIGGPFCQSSSCLFANPGPSYYLASISGWIVGGAIIGGITGVMLRLLLTQAYRK